MLNFTEQTGSGAVLLVWSFLAILTLNTYLYSLQPTIALKIAAETLISLRYKLRMLGIPIDGPSNVFCDNQSIVTNSSCPELPLKKKHISICYHCVSEACAAGIICIAYKNTKTNLADCLTKNLSGLVLKLLISKILY